MQVLRLFWMWCVLTLPGVSALHAHTVINLELWIAVLADGQVVLRLEGAPRLLAAMACTSEATEVSMVRRSDWTPPLLAALRHRLTSDLLLRSGTVALTPSWIGVLSETDGPLDARLLPKDEAIIGNWNLPDAQAPLSCELRLFPGRNVIVSCIMHIERDGQVTTSLIGSTATLPPESGDLTSASHASMATSASIAASATPAAPVVLQVERQTSAWWWYLLKGFRHIIPDGLDHIVFVLGLWLGARSLRQVLWTVTAFTVAHSLTLGLTVSGLIVISDGFSRAIEITIAASIAWIAIENICWKERPWWRFLLVGAFGLIHGLGFAGAMAETPWPAETGGFLGALVLANLGIELAQCAIILACAALSAWAWNRAWYRGGVVIPVSAAIGLVGLIWMAERLIGT